MIDDPFREMSARQYLLALKQLGLSHSDAGRMIGITDKMSRNYGNGVYPVPQAYAGLLRLLLKHEGPDSPVVTQFHGRPVGRPPREEVIDDRG